MAESVLDRALYGLYERRLTRALVGKQVPGHIGIMMDGNRRWARQVSAPPAHGHRAGADKIVDVLGWADQVGVKIVTLWMLSTDNLNRDPEELHGAGRDHRGRRRRSCRLSQVAHPRAREPRSPPRVHRLATAGRGGPHA